MYSRLLDQEDRKKFLELIYKLAGCDGEFAEAEQELIDNYKAELDISEISDTDSIHGLAGYFGEKEEEVKRIVLLEVWGLMLADARLGEKEQEAFACIKQALQLEEQTADAIIRAADELQRAHEQVYDAVFGWNGGRFSVP